MIQKARKFISSILTTALLAGTVNAVAMDSSLPFSDVPSTHWAYGSIQTMVDMGVVHGVGSDRFRPNGKVTAAQFAAMVSRAFPADEQEGLVCKNDKTDNMACVGKQNTVTMNAAMTRATMASVLVSIMNQQGGSCAFRHENKNGGLSLSATAPFHF